VLRVTPHTLLSTGREGCSDIEDGGEYEKKFWYKGIVPEYQKHQYKNVFYRNF
jgi:hypothetical protein